MSRNNSRLFLALWPEKAVQHTLQVWRDEWTWPSGTSLVAAESLHLTLHFLGNVPNSRLPELVQGLQVSLHPFDLMFSRPQVWPHGVVVLEPDSVPGDLLKLHASLKAALQHLELPAETRAFRPHITLARHAAGVLLPADTHFIKWNVCSYALIKSEQERISRYSVVHIF